LWQGYLTQQAIKTANRQAKAAEDANKLARETAARAAKDNVQSTQQNRETFAATVAQNRLDQRAWVGLKTLIVLPLAVGQRVRADLTFTNTGKTLALNTTAKTGIGIAAKNGPPDWFYGDKWKNTKVFKNVVFPQGEIQTKVYIEGFLLDSAWLALLQDGRQKLYVYGRCEYDDVFGKKHFTEFCDVYQPETGSVLTCATHNSAN